MVSKVCFVAPYSYPLFNPEYRTMFGGWEVRIATITKELAKRGNYTVSIIVADHGQPHIENKEGVELISWTGKLFWGIPPVPNEPSKPENPVPIAIVQQENLSVQNSQVATEASALSPIDPEAANDQSIPGLSHGSALLKKKVKQTYKNIVPWRVRIVVTGFLSGTKNGVTYFIGSVLRSVRESVELFVDRVRAPLSISRRAIGHIADEAVFKEMIDIFTEVNADIYVVPGNTQQSAEVAWFCKKNKRIYIMLAGSDIDFSPEIAAKPAGKDFYGTPYFYKLYAILNAKIHIVQNETQAEQAKAFGCTPHLIPNPVDLELKFPRPFDPKIILWVGNTVERVKRPSLILEAARQLPMYSFLMIVTPEHHADFERLTQAAQALPNLTLLSRVPFAEVEKYFAQAKLFVNTSNFEGFPNTFLQAGKYGIPIISLKVDPNGIISQHGSGLLCNDDPAILVASIQRMMTEADLYQGTSENILNYLRQYHDKDKIIPQYETVFRTALNPKGIAQVR